MPDSGHKIARGKRAARHPATGVVETHTFENTEDGALLGMCGSDVGDPEGVLKPLRRLSWIYSPRRGLTTLQANILLRHRLGRQFFSISQYAANAVGIDAIINENMKTASGSTQYLATPDAPGAREAPAEH